MANGAGQPVMTPHIVCCPFAKQLLDAGVDLAMVARFLGPERLETTGSYTQADARSLEGAVQYLGADAVRR